MLEKTIIVVAVIALLGKLVACEQDEVESHTYIVGAASMVVSTTSLSEIFH